MGMKRRFASWRLAAALALASQIGCMTTGALIGAKLESPAVMYTAIPVGFFVDGLLVRPIENQDDGTLLWIGSWTVDAAVLLFLAAYAASK